MKIGGLFSGVGGFELAWTQLGHEVAWMCEWDKNARKVLEARFPGVPIYPDVRELDPAEVEAVDVLTGGSPCQGFSVAGTRSGLEHSESQLFGDYIRIVEGLAERGLRWALWENVPGVLSIEDDNGERTFEHVVAALAGGTEPVRLDRDKRWNAGLAVGQGRAVAWRVLDSRHFGVAQRRRRVFACVAFGDSCEDRAVRSLLVVPQGMLRDSAEGEATGQGSSSGTAVGAGIPGVAGTLGAKGSGGIDDLDRMTYIPQVAGSLKAKHDGGATGDGRGMEVIADHVGALKARSYKGLNTEEVESGQAIVQEYSATVTSKWAKGTGGPSGSETGNLVLDSAKAFNWQSGGDARGLDLTDETSSLTCQQTPAVLLSSGEAVHAYRKSKRAASNTDDESWVEDGNANTLSVFDAGDTRTTHAIVQPTEEMVDFGRTSDRIRINADTAATLQSGGGGGGAKTGLYMIQGSVEGRADTAGPAGKGWKEDESFTLNTADRHSIAGADYGVRRLTPVECERLQSFPDGWTEPSGSDSARYKAMGNAVTVNTVRWVLGKMLEADRIVHGH